MSSNPLVHAFFVGRAFAEALSEQFQQSLTTALSDLGKFDAEQRERLRQFTEKVLEKANQDEAASMQSRPAATTLGTAGGGEDLQTILDELRAEIAQLRAELQLYRNRSL
ncbi:MAG TPA: hypothetical protein IGS37_04385 [Synechococcales cyanobacterium M55_K2018_004]|nr:hypothetical protein [Synechococcales cyanobacterium M55_K2018_004]